MNFRLNPLSAALLLAGFMPFAVQAVDAPVIADGYINLPTPAITSAPALMASA